MIQLRIFIPILDLIRLAIPIAISRSGIMLMALTDTIILVRYAPNHVEYIILAWIPVSIGLGLGTGLLQGVQVITSELIGQGAAEFSGRVWRRGMGIALLSGFIFIGFIFLLVEPIFMLTQIASDKIEGALLPTFILTFGVLMHLLMSASTNYLEALRKPNLVGFVIFIGVAINLFANLLLVAGWFGLPNHGAVGVAWATCASRGAIMLILIALVYRLTPGFKPSPKAPKGEGIRQNIVGLGTGLANIVEYGAFNITFVFSILIGTVAAITYNVAIQLISMTYMLFLGLGTATSVQIAEAIGYGNRRDVRLAGYRGIAASCFIGLICTLIMIAYNDNISHLILGSDKFSDADPMVFSLLPLLIALTACVVLLDGLQAVASMGLRAQGIVWHPMLIHLGSYIVVMLPAAYWLGIYNKGGAVGLIQGVIIASLIAAGLQVIRLIMAGGRIILPSDHNFN